MVKVRCQRCHGEAEADSIDEAKNKVDHAIGIYRGRPCANINPTYDVIGKVEPQKIETKVAKSPEKIGRNTSKSRK